MGVGGDDKGLEEEVKVELSEEEREAEKVGERPGGGGEEEDERTKVCKKCKHTFTDLTNSDSACTYHPGMVTRPFPLLIIKIYLLLTLFLCYFIIISD